MKYSKFLARMLLTLFVLKLNCGDSAGVGAPFCLAGCATTLPTCMAVCVGLGPLMAPCEAACVLGYSGCVLGCGGATCFHPSTMIHLEDGGSVPISDIQQGQEISTLGSDFKITSTKVEDVHVFEGEFEFVEFKFEDFTRPLVVTVDHVVLASGVAAKAGNVTNFEVMQLLSESGEIVEAKIVSIRRFVDTKKVRLFTHSGTAIVDRVFTTSICAGFEIGLGLPTQEFLESYHQFHVQHHSDFMATLTTWYEQHKEELKDMHFEECPTAKMEL